tara:strand:+ start:1470 stop:2087 length:618 start_codon:yes stop_codon:yes gene_type:complete
MVSLKRTVRLTPFMNLTLVGEDTWGEYVEENGTMLPSGIVEVTSPITAMKETFFISFDTQMPKDPVDHSVLENLIRYRIKQELSDYWESNADTMGLKGLVESIGWDNLLHRFDIITYEYTLGQRHAFNLFPGAWVTYRETPPQKVEPSKPMGTLSMGDGRILYLFFTNLVEMDIEDIGPLYQLRTLVEEKAKGHFGDEKLEWEEQ